MRSLLALLLFLALPAPVAAEARTYAVLSLAGNRLLIAQYDMGTGSRLDRNVRQFFALPDDSLDRIALRAVRAAIARTDAAAEVLLVAAGDARLYAAANTALESGSVQPMLPTLKAQLQPVKATHWIVVTRHRGEARAQLADGTVGAGSFEGLGFYLDRAKRVRNVDTGVISTGFVSPFAYLRFSLVEAGTPAIVREETVMLSTTRAKADAGTPWEALDAEQKVRILEQLINEAAAESVPKLLRP